MAGSTHSDVDSFIVQGAKPVFEAQAQEQLGGLGDDISAGMFVLDDRQRSEKPCC